MTVILVTQMANALGERLAAASSSTPATVFPLADRTKRKEAVY